MKHKGFTLAEIMIVLTVIGILTAILLPSAIHSTPDENVMKFKKANATLYKVIHELVTSNQFYTDGDLGKTANGNLVTSATYFCETLADIMSMKSTNCSSVKNGSASSGSKNAARIDLGCTGCTAPELSLSEAKTGLDSLCQENTNAGEELVLSDGVVFYQTSPGHHFGVEWDQDPNYRLFGCTKSDGTYCFKNSQGFDRIYKIFCIDVDGINKGEAPFGYGIRADGKIITGARADEWLKKSVQDKD